MTPDFHTEVQKLRQRVGSHGRTDDEDWWRVGGVVTALEQFLIKLGPQDWSDDDVTDLLFVLEQSSTSYIAELFGQDEETLLALARHSLARGGVASDDLAEQLQYCVGHRDEAESLLLAFLGDSHERTRRMALLSLAALQSSSVPALAEAAWNTGDEYQRMGALSALKTVGSDLFPIYLAKAFEDGRQNLLALARRYQD
ncbi:HEAT repeat domain-containing protein [Massilia sp. 9I]|uniref:HEAT repeat domain-containing protein n=1 Tax=Massilia sp. 9I TaxID=2653152 RepID=UPI0012F2817C|nr:HEAT repeat domain-containing protein [Massilia sp. 9I]VXB27564.1 conserved hypothetical protein [Massilia sp. 9I]